MSLTWRELDRLAKDTGCKEHDDCLTCPLPQCIYDVERRDSPVKIKAALRDKEIRELYPCKTISELMEMYGVCNRTIQRVLKGR